MPLSNKDKLGETSLLEQVAKSSLKVPVLGGAVDQVLN
jgi:hypothetical protein